MTGRETAALAVIALLLAYAAVAVPIRTARMIPELRRRIAEDPLARFAFYQRFPATCVLMTAVFAGVLWLGEADPAVAGIAWPPEAWDRLLQAFLAGAVVVAAVLALARLVGGRRDPAAFDEAAQFARIEFLVPLWRKERRFFPVVAASVAVTEELLYRGLLLLYAATLLGVDPWWLVVPTSVVFGLAHRYQGWLGTVATSAAGVLLGIVTVATGSLWPAVGAHFLVDLRLLALKRPEPAAPDAAAASAPPQAPPG